MLDAANDSYTMASQTVRELKSTSPTPLLSTVIFPNTTEDFWADFVRPPFELHPMRKIATTCLGILGLPSHILLIAIMVTSKYREYSYSIYFATTSVYDFLYFLDEVSQNILALFTNSSYINHYIKQVFLCRVYVYIFYTLKPTSLLFNLAIAVDRFIVIAFPFKKNIWCNRRNSWIVTIGVLVIIHSYGIVYFVDAEIDFTPINNVGYYCERGDLLYILDLYVNQMGIVLITILVGIFSGMCVFKLYSVRKKQVEMTSSQPITKENKMSRATVALVTIGVSAFVSQFPFFVYNVVNTMLIYNDAYFEFVSVDVPLWFINLMLIIESLSFVTHMQNFYILFMLNGAFRRDVFNMLKCRPSKE